MSMELHKVRGYTRDIVLVGWPADKVPDLYPHTPVLIDGSLDSILAHERDLLSATVVVFYPTNDILYGAPCRKGCNEAEGKSRYDEGLSILHRLIARRIYGVTGGYQVIVLLPEHMDDSDSGIWKRWLGLSLDTPPQPFPFDTIYRDLNVTSHLYRWISHESMESVPGDDALRCVMEGRPVRAIFTPGDGLSAMLSRLDASSGEDGEETRFKVIPIEGSRDCCSAVRIEKRGKDIFLLPTLPDPGPFIEHVVRFLFRYGIETLPRTNKIMDVFDNDWAREQVERAMRGPNPIVGESAAILRIYPGLLDAFLNPKDPILVYGPIGSGKEVLFDALRQLHSSDRDLIVEDISGLDPTAVMSLLFGHVRGSYTGASRSRKGAVETAGDGTLVIDNFQNAALPLQAKLLRLLEKRGEYQRLGSDVIRHSKARIVVAMNVEPGKYIAAGQFLPDLISRFPIQITIPSLNERRVDIPLLVHALTSHYMSQTGLADTLGKEMLSPTFYLDSWMVDDWDGPCGNVRGLRNAVEGFIRRERRDFCQRRGISILPSKPNPVPTDDSLVGPKSRRGRKKGRYILDRDLSSLISEAAADLSTHSIQWIFTRLDERYPPKVRRMARTQRALTGRIGRMEVPGEEKQRLLNMVRRIQGFGKLPFARSARTR